MTLDDERELDEHLERRLKRLRRIADRCRAEAEAARAPDSPIAAKVTEAELRTRYADSPECLKILNAANAAAEVAERLAYLKAHPEPKITTYHSCLAYNPSYGRFAHALARLETQQKIVEILTDPPHLADEQWEASLNASATREEAGAMERATFAVRMAIKTAQADFPESPTKQHAQIQADLADDLRFARIDLDSIMSELTIAANTCPLGPAILDPVRCREIALAAAKDRLIQLHALSSRRSEVAQRYAEEESQRIFSEARVFDRKADKVRAQLSARRELRLAEELAAEQAKQEQLRLWEIERQQAERQKRIQSERDMGPRAYLENRGVPCLLHFTRTAYLPAILREGLLSRAELEHRHPRPRFNDLQRLDGEPDTISCSIGHPNAATLHRFRERAGLDTWWCIIAINLAVLDQQPALFCIENAAATGVVADARRRSAMGDHARALFGDIDCKHGRVKRDSLKLAARLPTHPQAEVLVSAPILPAFIIGACFPDQMGLHWARQRAPRDFVLEISPGMFKSRCDWKQWLGGSHG